jgi:hypothetical protein
MAASNLLAAPDRRFAASLCHAKITPAVLRRGEFGDFRRESMEAAVLNSEFELSDLRRPSAAMPRRAQSHHAWQHVEQSLLYA